MSEYVVGYRYIKQDSSYTEDLFLIRPLEVKKFPKWSYQRKNPLYRNTHKAQLPSPSSSTSTNTIALGLNFPETSRRSFYI